MPTDGVSSDNPGGFVQWYRRHASGTTAGCCLIALFPSSLRRTAQYASRPFIVSFREASRFCHFEEHSDFVISRSVATRNPCPEQSERSLRLLTCVRSDGGTFEVTFKNVISRSASDEKSFLDIEMTQSIVFKGLASFLMMRVPCLKELFTKPSSIRRFSTL